jgi:ribosomal protein S18 acetylase RimI-like enzyme
MYRISRLTDITQLRAFLDSRQDAYMKGDLCEPYWSNAEFYGAFVGERLVSVVLKYAPISPPPIISAGDSEGVRAIYAQLSRTTPELFYHAMYSHMSAVETYYDYNPSKHLAMWRMICTAASFQKMESSEYRLQRLTPADSRRLEALQTPPKSVLESGTFLGLELDGQIVSMAGTHIINLTDQIGVIGWVITHPVYRGRGFAKLCTSAVTESLLGQGCQIIALNVIQMNTPAVRAYQRIGFAVHNPLWEGVATVKSQA